MHFPDEGAGGKCNKEHLGLLITANPKPETLNPKPIIILIVKLVVILVITVIRVIRAIRVVRPIRVNSSHSHSISL